MDVSVEVVSDLERKLTVSVPQNKIEEKFDAKIKELTPKVKLAGFRPGKVPANIVKQRFGEAMRGEIIGDVMRDTLVEALKEKKLTPVGIPQMEITQSKHGEPLVYVATFEIYPEVKLKPIAELELERVQASVVDDDVNTMLEKVRKQNTEWNETERAAKNHDRINIDFDGTIDGETFQGNSAKEFDLKLGSNTMVPGFEEGLIGVNKGEERELKVEFPKDYRAKELAGKKAVFKVKVNKISESKLPELDDALAEKNNIEGGIDGLTKQVRTNMEQELEQIVKNRNRDHVFEKLLKANPVEIPKALVKSEYSHLIKQTKQMMKMQTGQEEIPAGQEEEFQQLAKRRAAIGLLVQKFIEDNDIKVNQDLVRKIVDDIASTYHTPEHAVNWYYRNKEQMQQIEAAVIEQQCVEKIFEIAKVTDKTLSYDEMMHLKTEEGR